MTQIHKKMTQNKKPLRKIFRIIVGTNPLHAFFKSDMAETKSTKQTMNHTTSRRAFIKQAGIVAAVSGISLSAWSKGLEKLYSAGVNPGNEFSLLKLERLLPGYSFPEISSFSTDAFTLEYDLYNMYHTNDTYAGMMRMTEHVRGRKRINDFHNERLATDGIMDRSKRFRYFVSGNVVCSNDQTFTPEKWDISSKIALTADTPAYLNTGLNNKGSVRNKQVRIQSAGKNIRLTYDNDALTWKWGIISLVQTMAKNNVNALQFASLDEFDICYNNQSVVHRRNSTIDCGAAGQIRFKVFEHLGEGIVPTVYWVDDKNRTVFVITGMESYILKA